MNGRRIDCEHGQKNKIEKITRNGSRKTYSQKGSEEGDTKASRDAHESLKDYDPLHRKSENVIILAGHRIVLTS